MGEIGTFRLPLQKQQQKPWYKTNTEPSYLQLDKPEESL